MAQRVKAHATEPDDLNSIPRTHMVEGKNTLRKAVLWTPRTHMHACECKINTQKSNLKQTFNRGGRGIKDDIQTSGFRVYIYLTAHTCVCMLADT